MLVRPLSIVPSQSLSLPSQISPVGPIAPTHTMLPAWHLLSPWRHSPTPLPHFAGCGIPFLSTSGLLSSIVPLQSLSLLSQISGAGFFVQPSLPFVHVIVPPAHSPVWFAHAWPTSATSSSILPS